MRTKEWLKKTREKFHLSQKKMSEESGINKFTIENIEQGRRKGTDETWKLIEEYFKTKEKGIYSFSVECEDLIDEIKEDINEFGENCPAILVYKISDNQFIFTNYNFIGEEIPFNPEKDLEEDELYLETTLKYVLDVFEKQNKI